MFLKAIPLKMWFYLALVLAYPVCYFVGHHKGFDEGEAKCVANYVKQQEEQAAQNKKDNEKDKQQAAKASHELVDKISQLQSSKDSLQKQLDAYSKNKPKAAISCPSLSRDDVRVLSDAVNKANN
jgi:hypothetical protein